MFLPSARILLEVGRGRLVFILCPVWLYGLSKKRRNPPRAILSTHMIRMIVGLVGSSEFISSKTIPTIDSKMMNKSNWFHLLTIRIIVTEGAFHYTKKSGDFGRNSNGEVCFGLFEVVHFDRSDRPDNNAPLYFDKSFHCPSSLQ